MGLIRSNPPHNNEDEINRYVYRPGKQFRGLFREDISHQIKSNQQGPSGFVFPLSAWQRVGYNYILVLAFATTCDGAGGRPARFGEKMAIFSKYMLKFAKTGMDFSCHVILSRGEYNQGPVGPRPLFRGSGPQIT